MQACRAPLRRARARDARRAALVAARFRSTTVALQPSLSAFARAAGAGDQHANFSTTPPNGLSSKSGVRHNTFHALSELDASAAPYAREMKKLGKLLGDAAAGDVDGASTLKAIESLRKGATHWRSARRDGDEVLAADLFSKMVASVASLEAAQLRDVSRAFAHFLALSNAAESEQRRRRLETKRVEGSALFPLKVDSCPGTVALLLGEGKSIGEVVEKISKQRVEIVLTAHPTEVHRRTLLVKHRRVTDLLHELADGGGRGFEKEELERDLAATVRALWGSDELRRSKPTPQKEARGALAVIETSLWAAVPQFLRRLDATLAQHGGALPLDAVPVAFATWMGGDRDGNPNVTAQVTAQVVAAQRLKGAELFIAELDALRLDLSVTTANSDIVHRAGVANSPKRAQEPYKRLIDMVVARLRLTAAWAASPEALMGARTSTDGIFDKDELLELLTAMHASLCETGHAALAGGRLLDTIRRVQTFGLQLAPLDVRQESDKHARAIDALRCKAGQKGYLDMSSTAKLAWLSAELVQHRPLLRRGEYESLIAETTDGVDRDVLETALYLARAPAGAVGAYVISQATAAADVLAVELLLAEVGAPRMRIVPLFETLDDLNNAPAALAELFSAPGYLDRVGHVQEIMVGYSDSAKDAGRLAASWAQYEQQEKMLAVAKQFNVEVTFFHGKGGTVGRGGNPETYRAILAHPPATIDGRFRITEQGECIGFNFGAPDVATRTLDIFTAAVLRDSFQAAPDVLPKWRATMAALSATSCAKYRAIVRGEPDFVPFFRAATPERELAALNLGSRPAKRNPAGGVESLRAIPWIFAWTQTRLNLPAWLGIGDAFAEQPTADLKDMVERWPWFSTNIDLIEMLLAKTEAPIAAHYESVLVEDPKLKQLGERLRTDLAVTTTQVLRASGRPAPGAENALLQRALLLRNPCVCMGGHKAWAQGRRFPSKLHLKNPLKTPP
mmetsp:Transcript_32432/g.114100  ORF Transcript_32432/g.114100 Transcript_32432/m.114100 type:complete len:965 (-) Transcript_32432:18-2912(-)